MKFCITLSCKTCVTGSMPHPIVRSVSLMLFRQPQTKVSLICKTFTACLTGLASWTHCYCGLRANPSMRLRSSVVSANSISFSINLQFSDIRVRSLRTPLLNCLSCPNGLFASIIHSEYLWIRQNHSRPRLWPHLKLVLKFHLREYVYTTRWLAIFQRILRSAFQARVPPDRGG